MNFEKINIIIIWDAYSNIRTHTLGYAYYIIFFQFSGKKKKFIWCFSLAVKYLEKTLFVGNSVC